MEDKTIYISGPIGNAGKCSPEEQLQNIINGEELYGSLMSKGYSPFLPHLSYYPDKRWRDENITKYIFDHEHWLGIDKQWVHKCKYFFYMSPETYGDSKGALIELGWAKDYGKRIFYDINEVPSKLEIPV